MSSLFEYLKNCAINSNFFSESVADQIKFMAREAGFD